MTYLVALEVDPSVARPGWIAFVVILLLAIAWCSCSSACGASSARSTSAILRSRVNPTSSDPRQRLGRRHLTLNAVSRACEVRIRPAQAEPHRVVG